MPRVSINSEKYKTADVVRLIKAEMFVSNVTQKQMSELLNISQQSMSAKFKNGNFTLRELVRIFSYLKIDGEKIGKAFT